MGTSCKTIVISIGLLLSIPGYGQAYGQTPDVNSSQSITPGQNSQVVTPVQNNQAITPRQNDKDKKVETIDNQTGQNKLGNGNIASPEDFRHGAMDPDQQTNTIQNIIDHQSDTNTSQVK